MVRSVNRAALTFVKWLWHAGGGLGGRVAVWTLVRVVRFGLALSVAGIRAISFCRRLGLTWHVESLELSMGSPLLKPDGGWAFRVRGSSSSSGLACLVLCRCRGDSMCLSCPWSCMRGGAQSRQGGEATSEGMGCSGGQ